MGLPGGGFTAFFIIVVAVNDFSDILKELKKGFNDLVTFIVE